MQLIQSVTRARLAIKELLPSLSLMSNLRPCGAGVIAQNLRSTSSSRMAETESKRVTMVIDCDAGIDDAAAIMMMLGQKHVDLLGVTCVDGNTTVEKVAINVLRTLKACNRLDIPVYKGACKDLLGVGEEKTPDEHDGLGDALHRGATPSPELVQSEHAVQALIRMVRERPHQVTLVATGPLTNIALAMCLDTEFTSRLKELVIMGGNILATGSWAPAAEFNFWSDPSAAHNVIQGVDCPTKLVPLETCQSHAVSCEWFANLQGKQTQTAKFLSDIYAKKIEARRVAGHTECRIADGCAALVAARPEAVQRSEVTPCLVECQGKMTKGQMITCKIYRNWVKPFPGPEIEVVLNLDMEMFYDTLNDAVK